MVFVKGIDDRLVHLASHERDALDAIVTSLHLHYHDDLLGVVLFGSKARGDFDEESDLDLLIVVRMQGDEYWDHWLKIGELTWMIELEYGVVTTMIIKDESGFEKMRKHGLLLFREIERDGITLWRSQPSEFILLSS